MMHNTVNKLRQPSLLHIHRPALSETMIKFTEVNLSPRVDSCDFNLFLYDSASHESVCGYTAVTVEMLQLLITNKDNSGRLLFFLL